MMKIKLLKNNILLGVFIVISAVGMAQTEFRFFNQDGFTYRYSIDNGVISETVQLRAANPDTTPSDVIIPEEVSDGDNTFRVESISNDTFRGFGLTSVILPNSVEVIVGNAFRDNQIRNIVFPENLTIVGGRTFIGNPIEEITFQSSTPPTVFGEFIANSNEFVDAIDNRTNVRLVVPPSSINAYRNSNQLQDFFAINGVYARNSGVQLNVNKIRYRFPTKGKNEVDIVGSQSGVASNLVIDKEIIINGISFDLIDIENSAFQNRGLTAVTINHKKLKRIRGNAFRNNTIKTLTFGDDLALTDIELDAFNGNELTKVTLPKRLQNLGTAAFRNNPLNEVISLNPVAPSIAGNTFTRNDRDQINLIIPTGRSVILSYAEKGWNGFASVNNNGQILVDDIVYRITSSNPREVEVFKGTTGKENLVIPSEITREDFNGNRSEFTVTKIADFAFFAKNLSGRLELPETITSIGENSLRNNRINQLVVAPNSALTSIGEDAFNSNRLTNLELPESLTAIGESAFRNNPLEVVVSKNPNPPTIQEFTFSLNNRDQIDVLVPSGSAQNYIAGGWTGFKSINEPALRINLKVFLQGAAINPIAGEENLLRDDLRVSGLIPTTSPYAEGLTIESTVMETEGANAIVDWVLVQLRDATDQSNVLAEQSALLQRDGDVVGTDGLSPLRFTQNAGDYFIAVEHRNHLGILSANAIALSNAPTVIDFTTDLSVTQGGINALVAIRDGVFAMVAGDLDENGQVQPSDVSQTTAQIGTAAYSNADMDMNGQIQPADVNTLINPNVGRGVQLLARSIFFTAKSKGAQEQIEFIYAPKVQAPNKQAATGRQLTF